MARQEQAERAGKAGAGWLAPALIAGTFAILFVAERRRPLRRQRESRPRRTARNFAMAGLTAAVMSVVQAPLIAPLARRVEREQSGLLPRLKLGTAARTLVGVLLLDYTLWWWHWLNHRLPFLWRFHLVHHVDRDMDASTAIRFHFGEMSLSVLYRMAQVRLLGIDRRTLSAWQLLLMVSIFFHHSNVRLSSGTERLLVRFLVTPRMHGIHHSDYLAETDSNWSSILSCWDYLHGTMRLDIPQQAITIGVPAYQHQASVTLPQLVLLPLRHQGADWADEHGVEKTERGPAPAIAERWQLRP
jgi:sterol desaturase/sphingolipid hydroxylase (fatty acid hydroxylase superfamily)